MASYNKGINPKDWGCGGYKGIIQETVKATGPGPAGKNSNKKHKGGMAGWGVDSGSRDKTLFNPGANDKDKGAAPSDIAPEQNKLEKGSSGNPKLML